MPVFYLVNNYFNKYNLEVETLKDWSKFKRNIDLDADGLTENFDISNIEKDHIYGEIWSSKSLVNVISQKDNLIKQSLTWEDIDGNGLIEAVFLKTYNDSLYLSSFEIDLSNKKNILKQKIKSIYCYL